MLTMMSPEGLAGSRCLGSCLIRVMLVDHLNFIGAEQHTSP
jgi:hypothetical protein